MAPSRFAADTSVLVAALCGWHERHEACRRAVQERLDQRQVLVLAAHSLVETYSVLTRLPPPHRLGAEMALAALEQSFKGTAELAGLAPAGHWRFLRDAVSQGVSGGRIYDWLIAGSVAKAGIRELLTLNLRHFADLEPDVRLVAPE